MTGQTRVSRIHFNKWKGSATCSYIKSLYFEDLKLEKEKEGKGGGDKVRYIYIYIYIYITSVK